MPASCRASATKSEPIASGDHTTSRPTRISALYAEGDRHGNPSHRDGKSCSP